MARIKMAGGPWVEIGGEAEEGDERAELPAGDELPVFLRRGRRGESAWWVIGSGDVPAPRRHAGLGVGVAAVVGFSSVLAVVSFCAGYLAGLVRLLGPQ